MCKALSDFGIVLFAGGGMLWGFMLVLRIIGDWSVGTLLVESIFSVIMTFGFMLAGFSGIFCEENGFMLILYLIAALAPLSIPLGLTVWMIGYYMFEARLCNGMKVLSAGKSIFKMGCLLSLIIMLIVFIFTAAKTSSRHRPAEVPPPQYKLSD